MTPPGNPNIQTVGKALAQVAELERHHPGGPPPPPVRAFATIAAVNFNTLIVNLGGSAIIEVIKPAKVCPALDKDVDGYTYQYSADTLGGQTRTSTLDTSVETQTVVPRFIVGDLVEIGPAPSNVAEHAASLGSFTLQVVNHPAMWDKVTSTPVGGT